MMARKTINTDPYVKVEPPASKVWGYSTFEKQVQLCRQIEADVQRHVDNVANTKIAWTTVHECEYCGAPWTEENDQCNGGCCDDDWDEELWDSLMEQGKA